MTIGRMIGGTQIPITDKKKETKKIGNGSVLVKRKGSGAPSGKGLWNCRVELTNSWIGTPGLEIEEERRITRILIRKKAFRSSQSGPLFIIIIIIIPYSSHSFGLLLEHVQR